MLKYPTIRNQSNNWGWYNNNDNNDNNDNNLSSVRIPISSSFITALTNKIVMPCSFSSDYEDLSSLITCRYIMRSSLSSSSSILCYPLYIRRNNYEYEYDDDDDDSTTNTTNTNNNTDLIILIDNNDDAICNFNSIINDIKKDLGLSIKYNNNSNSDPAGHFRPILLFMINNYMLENGWQATSSDDQNGGAFGTFGKTFLNSSNGNSAYTFLHVIVLKTITINNSMDEALLLFSTSCQRLLNNAKTNVKINNNNDYINSDTRFYLQPLFEELEVTDTKIIRVSEEERDNDNDDFLRRINILNRKRGYCEYIPSSIVSIARYCLLAFGLSLSTSSNNDQEYEMTFYAVESPILGTRWLPAQLFATSISSTDAHTKRFKTDAINAFVSDLNGLFHGVSINPNSYNTSNQATLPSSSQSSPMKIKPYFIEDIKILTSPLTLGSRLQSALQLKRNSNSISNSNTSSSSSNNIAISYSSIIRPTTSPSPKRSAKTNTNANYNSNSSVVSYYSPITNAKINPIIPVKVHYNPKLVQGVRRERKKGKHDHPQTSNKVDNNTDTGADAKDIMTIVDQGLDYDNDNDHDIITDTLQDDNEDDLFFGDIKRTLSNNIDVENVVEKAILDQSKNLLRDSIDVFDDSNSVQSSITDYTKTSPNAKNLLPLLSAPVPHLKFKRQDITNMAMMIAGKEDIEMQITLSQTLRISTPQINERSSTRKKNQGQK